eukprot:5089381-Ditylum_brightwellii.AAC.1
MIPNGSRVGGGSKIVDRSNDAAYKAGSGMGDAGDTKASRRGDESGFFGSGAAVLPNTKQASGGSRAGGGKWGHVKAKKRSCARWAALECTLSQKLEIRGSDAGGGDSLIGRG